MKKEETNRRDFLKEAVMKLGLAPLGLLASNRAFAQATSRRILIQNDPNDDIVLNAVADTILPRLNDGRPGDFSAGELDLPNRFYRDPYWGVSDFLFLLISDIQGRSFFEYTEAFESLTYEQRLRIFEDGRNNAFGPLKNLFNGIVALTYYAVFARTEEGMNSIAFSLDPTQNWRDFRYPGVSFPESGLTVGGNLP